MFNLFFIVASLSVVAATPTTEKSAPSSAVLHEMQQGDAAFKTFDNEEALKHFQKAVALDPENFQANLKLLRANNAKGQDLRDHNADSKDIEFYFRKNVELAEAIDKKFPNHAESPFCLAIAYGNLALYSSPREKVRLSENIEKDLKRSIALDPKFAYSYLGLAIFYREVSQINFLERFFAKLLFGEVPYATLEDSEKYFKIALQLDPKFIFTHYNYAKMLELEERWPEVVREYELVLSLPRSDYGDPTLRKLAKESLDDLKQDHPEAFEKKNQVSDTKQ